MRPTDPHRIETVNPGVELGRFRHALFDFDGTISVIREGWERVMVPLMIEMLAGEEGDRDGSVRREVAPACVALRDALPLVRRIGRSACGAGRSGRTRRERC